MDLPNLVKECDKEVEYILVGAGKNLIDKSYTIRFVSAGLPRTGTFSTFVALEKILPGKCHHMIRAMSGKNDPEFWTRASNGELVDDDWKNFIR